MESRNNATYNYKKKKKGKGRLLNSPVLLICVLVSISCILVLIWSILRLPDASVIQLHRAAKHGRLGESKRFGKFGEMLVQMLPDDLAFTVFLPSGKAFERDLKLVENSSLVVEEKDNTDAILSRVLGFSTIPRKIYSNSIRVGEELLFDSVSGFRLFVEKGSDGSLVVNGIRSIIEDMRKGEIVVHIMDGVIMDAEFEQSVQPDEDEDN